MRLTVASLFCGCVSSLVLPLSLPSGTELRGPIFRRVTDIANVRVQRSLEQAQHVAQTTKATDDHVKPRFHDDTTLPLYGLDRSVRIFKDVTIDSTGQGNFNGRNLGLFGGHKPRAVSIVRA